MNGRKERRFNVECNGWTSFDEFHENMCFVEPQFTVNTGSGISHAFVQFIRSATNVFNSFIKFFVSGVRRVGTRTSFHERKFHLVISLTLVKLTSIRLDASVSSLSFIARNFSKKLEEFMLYIFNNVWLSSRMKKRRTSTIISRFSDTALLDLGHIFDYCNSDPSGALILSRCWRLPRHSGNSCNFHFSSNCRNNPLYPPIDPRYHETLSTRFLCQPNIPSSRRFSYKT